MLAQKTARVEWLDVYKGLVMILVVVGHATGLFNGYIYQFHMAAFFFSSGYLDKTENKSLYQLVVNKFFTLYLPLFTFVVLGSLFEKTLAIFQIRSILYEGGFIGVRGEIQQFLVHGNLYFQSLGACWFILVLIGVFFLQKILLVLCGKRDGLYLLTALILFCMGYELIAAKKSLGLGPFSVDLILLANLYFSCGAFVRQYSQEHPERVRWGSRVRWPLLGLNLALFYFFAHVCVVVNDWPSRTFTNPLWDFLAAMNGIIFVWNLSEIIVRCLPQRHGFLCAIGQNTMGILVFHFLMFKVCFLVLWAVGQMPAAEISGVVPGEQVGARYWWAITAFSIAGSMLLWRGCKMVPGFRFLVGQQKEVYKKIEQLTVFSFSEKGTGGSAVASRITKLKQCMLAVRQWSFCHRWLSGVAVLSVGIAFFAANAYVQSGASGLAEFVEIVSYRETLSCEQGVYDDSWCSPVVVLNCASMRPRQLDVHGYYPAEVDGSQKIEIYVDGNLKQSLVLQDSEFQLCVDLQAGQKHQVRIESNFLMEAPADIRELSFVMQQMRLI